MSFVAKSTSSTAGASNGRPNVKNLQGSRGIYAYDILPGPILSNRRLFNLPVAGQYDGMRVTKSGYILAASAEARLLFSQVGLVFDD